MKNSLFLQISLFILISTLNFSCDKNYDFKYPPEISLKSAILTKTNTGDSVLFKIGYRDLDGDIGLSQGDTAPPFNTQSKYYYNIYTEYYEKDSLSNWRKVKPPLGNFDTIEFSYRIPPLTNSSTPKEINGDIQLGLILQTKPQYSKTIKFRIYLYDKALHRSNFVETLPLLRS